MHTELKDCLTALDGFLQELASQPLTQQAMLDGLTQFCVDHLSAAFARIWLVEDGGAVLVLKSSCGQYTNLNGTRARISIGQGSKIDKMYVDGKAHVTNDVLNDPGVKDKEWAQREGFCAFAGYPLVWHGEKLGVLGMYSREYLPEEILLVLGTFSLLTSAMIFQMQQTERNMSRFCEVTGFKHTLLDRLITVGRNGHGKQ